MSINLKQARRFWQKSPQSFRFSLLQMCEIKEGGGIEKFKRFDWEELPNRVKNPLRKCMEEFDLIQWGFVLIVNGPMSQTLNVVLIVKRGLQLNEKMSLWLSKRR